MIQKGQTFKKILFNKITLPMGSVFTLLLGVIGFQFYFTIQSISNNTINECLEKGQRLGDFIAAQILVNNEIAISQKISEFNLNQSVAEAAWNPENIQPKNEYEFLPFYINVSLPVQASTQKFGHLNIKINLLKKDKIKVLLEFSFCIFIISIALLSYLFFYATSLFPNKYISMPLIKLVNTLHNEKVDEPNDNIELVSEFEKATKISRELLESAKEASRIESLVKVASQISHDIRSPLSALEMMLSVIHEVPEEKRQIIRNSVYRIRDIANDLLNKNRDLNSTIVSNSSDIETLKVCLIHPLIDEIISEKRIQFRNLIDLVIIFDQSENSFGLFSLIDSVEFKRCISNLLNNAIEALPGKRGVVQVFLKSFDNMNLVIDIVDNGIGIPSELLTRIGQRGATFNKESGSGLGLYGSIEAVKKWSGTLKIESKVNFGTTVSICLPIVKTPAWFLSKITVQKNSSVICVDDDQTIHQIWKNRFTGIDMISNNISLIHFTDTKSLRSYYGDHLHSLSRSVFLIDYEILGSEENGLEMIRQLGISNQSILVTSRYDDSKVRDESNVLNLKILPKSMSGFVPIEITEKKDNL